MEKSKFTRQLLPMQSDKRHDNIVSLIGVSLNAPPFLALLEFCGVGDLKTFLNNATGIWYTINLTSLSELAGLFQISLIILGSMVGCVIQTNGRTKLEVGLSVSLLPSSAKLVVLIRDDSKNGYDSDRQNFYLKFHH